MKKLENKVAVITGGNSGIGLAAAILFAEQGARVAITGRNEVSLRNAERLIGHDCIAIASDISDLESLGAAYEKVKDKWGNIDILIVNAGVARATPFAEYTEALFDEISDINFKGAFFTIRLALPYLNDGASIILTSSATNEKGFPGYSVYAATKAALRSLARTISSELLGRNIRVNVISPGAIDTPFYSRNGDSPEAVAGAKTYIADKMIPAKRLGTASEIAEGLLYLASDASRYIIGAELVIDGGVKTL